MGYDGRDLVGALIIITLGSIGLGVAVGVLVSWALS